MSFPTDIISGGSKGSGGGGGNGSGNGGFGGVVENSIMCTSFGEDFKAQVSDYNKDSISVISIFVLIF